ncbi:MAG: hypothetical protein ACR2IN_08090, partial [Thermoleophilaceae bacterium]
MAWVETQSASFTARHESAAGDRARAMLDALERFRAGLERAFPDTPGEVAVVIHPQYAQLAMAQPVLPLAQLVAAPASRRYFGGWFASGEVHVLDPEVLRDRASAVPDSREALRLAPAHEYAHLVIGRNNVDLPPPFTLRSFRDYLRWAWLCEGAATYFSGQHRHLGAAVARRLREGTPPKLPPSARDAALLGGAVFGLLERIAGREACADLARAPLDGAG